MEQFVSHPDEGKTPAVKMRNITKAFGSVLANDKVALLLAFPNVIVTSHQAFFTHTALQAIAQTTLENARAFQRGEPLANRVE